MNNLSMKIAKAYEGVLSRNLTKSQFDSVMNEGVHPDQYLDANMILEEAFIKVMGRDSDLETTDLDLLNDSIRIFHNDFCLINSNII